MPLGVSNTSCDVIGQAIRPEKETLDTMFPGGRNSRLMRKSLPFGSGSLFILIERNFCKPFKTTK